MRIYVAGPYTNGDVAQNVKKAITIGDALFNMGHKPYIPHLTHFWHILYEHTWKEWMELDEAFLPLCDSLFRIEGKSIGADGEVALALSLDMPIYYSLEEVPRVF